MIIVVIHREFDPKTNKYVNIISHGVDENGNNVVLEQIPLNLCTWVRWDKENNCYVLR